MPRRTLWWIIGGVAVVVVGIVVAVVLRGGATPMAQTSPSPSPSPVDPSRVSPKLPSVPTVTDEAGAIKDATFGSCQTTAGAQEVTGKITSSASGTADYVITVSWVNETSDVLARGVDVLKGVPAGGSKDFTVKADVPDGATTCTFHVVRGSLG